MNQEEVLELFEKANAVQYGHFLLSSGYHTDTYYQCARIFQHPHLAEKVGHEIAAMFQGKHADVVLSPAVGGILSGFAVALVLGCRSIFAEREAGQLALRRGFSIEPGEHVLIVEDVVTTGGSSKEVIDIARRAKAKLVGLATVLNRGEKKEIGGLTVRALLSVNPPLWRPEDCPLCAEGKPLVSPGSRRLRKK